MPDAVPGVGVEAKGSVKNTGGNLSQNQRYIAKRGATDTVHNLIGTLLAGAAVAAAGYNTVQAIQIALKQYEMAKKYYNIAKWWLDFYKSQYAPVENQEVTEALNLEHETPQYETARGRTRTNVHLQFKGAIQKAIRCTSEYCTGLRKDMVEELMSGQAVALSLADGLGYRNERAYVESREDVRFNKMLNTAKRGRDLFTGNVSLAKATAKAYGEAFEQTWQGLEGAGAYLGYYFNRNQTNYPQTSYISSTDGVSGSGTVVRSRPSQLTSQLQDSDYIANFSLDGARRSTDSQSRWTLQIPQSDITKPIDFKTRMGSEYYWDSEAETYLPKMPAIPSDTRFDMSFPTVEG